MTLAPLFKLLSDETRLRVLLLLFKEDLCVCELCGILDEPQPKISKILSKFRDMQLVTDHRKDKFVFYSLSPENKELTDLLTYIQTNISLHPDLIKDQERLLTKEIYLTTCAVPQRV